MRVNIVLAMHGSPPRDFPRDELAEFFRLHAQVESGTAEGGEPAGAAARHAELHTKMRTWPRSKANDPYFVASYDLGERLAQITGHGVIVGFNEFCSPSVDEVLAEGAARADTVIVVTTMTTRGGEHSEADIPAAIERVRQRYLATRFSYLWPVDVDSVADFLAAQVERHMAGHPCGLPRSRRPLAARRDANLWRYEE